MGNDYAVQVAAQLCRKFEGCYLRPYICPAGVATIGIGSTAYEDGTRVTLADPPITPERAEALLLWAIKHRYLPQVLRLCPAIPSPEKAAALIDFTYNLGAGNLKASNLRRRANAQDWDAVPAELRKWVRGGGKVLQGLVIRREAEVALVEQGAVR